MLWTYFSNLVPPVLYVNPYHNILKRSPGPQKGGTGYSPRGNLLVPRGKSDYPHSGYGSDHHSGYGSSGSGYGHSSGHSGYGQSGHGHSGKRKNTFLKYWEVFTQEIKKKCHFTKH